MAKGNNIHDEIKEQRKKLKDLSFSDKIKYIWSYYWIPIVGVVLAVIFAVSLISSIVEYIDHFCTDKDIFFCDLRDIFSDEELEQLDNYIVYFTNTAGETYPIAVDISEAPVIKDSDLNMKDPCYGVVSSSKYQTNAADFIRYVFNMKSA